MSLIFLEILTGAETEQGVQEVGIGATAGRDQGAEIEKTDIVTVAEAEMSVVPTKSHQSRRRITQRILKWAMSIQGKS